MVDSYQVELLNISEGKLVQWSVLNSLRQSLRAPSLKEVKNKFSHWKNNGKYECNLFLDTLLFSV